MVPVASGWWFAERIAESLRQPDDRGTVWTRRRYLRGLPQRDSARSVRGLRSPETSPLAHSCFRLTTLHPKRTMQIMSAHSKTRERAPLGTKHMRVPITPGARKLKRLIGAAYGIRSWRVIENALAFYARGCGLEESVRETVEERTTAAEPVSPGSGPVRSGGLSSTRSVEPPLAVTG